MDDSLVLAVLGPNSCAFGERISCNEVYDAAERLASAVRDAGQAE